MPTMPTITGTLPARYIGSHVALLQAALGPYYEIDGVTRRTKLTLGYGETLMMPAAEVLGQTFLFDPSGQMLPRFLGVGRVVLPEHVEKSVLELAQLGYEFHGGRPDFEAVPIAPSVAGDASQQKEG